jgi:flagellar hook-length control protein FliK
VAEARNDARAEGVADLRAALAEAAAASAEADAPPQSHRDGGDALAALLPDGPAAGAAGSTGPQAALAAAAPALPATADALPPALQPVSTPAAAPEAVPTQSMPMAPDTPDFAPALGAQVRLWVQDGVQQARLELTPRELGPVSVQISLDGQAARVDFAADLAATRQALEQALPDLAAALHAGGFTLSGGGVSQQGTPQGRQGGEPDSSAPGRDRGHAGDAVDTAALPTAAVAPVAVGRAGLLDLFA